MGRGAGRGRERLRRGLHRMRDKGLERLLLLCGAGLLLLAAAEAAALTVLRPAAGWALWRTLAVETFVGREAAFPIAIEGGVPPPLLAQVSFTQDLGVFCIAFPLVLRVLHRAAAGDGFVVRRLRRMQESARRHERFALRWGPVGVFLFMLVPFLVNGPLVGGIMGRMAGLPTRSLLLPVAAATAVAAAAWTYFYDGLFRLANAVPGLPAILTGCIVGGLVAWLLIDAALHARRERRRGPEP